MAGSMSGLSPESVSLEELVKCSRQIEQNTRSEQTAVLYKTRKELGAKKVRTELKKGIGLSAGYSLGPCFLCLCVCLCSLPWFYLRCLLLTEWLNNANIA